MKLKGGTLIARLALGLILLAALMLLQTVAEYLLGIKIQAPSFAHSVAWVVANGLIWYAYWIYLLPWATSGALP